MSDIFPTIETYQGHDGVRLAVRIWQPSSPPVARLVLLHGIISHSGWYARSCAYWAGAGIAVHFLDRRGSGLNHQARGDVDCWTTWWEDVEAYLNQLGAGSPRILGGISWGGKLAAAVARRRLAPIAGLALICPGIYAHQQPGPFKRLALATARLPWLGKRRVDIPLSDPALFTDSPVDREYIRADPLTLRQVTLRFARHDQVLTQFARAAAPDIGVSVLLVLAQRDRIVVHGQMRSYFESISSSQKTLRDYPQAAHTLDFEPDPMQYFHDVADWIRSVAQNAQNANV